MRQTRAGVFGTVAIASAWMAGDRMQAQAATGGAWRRRRAVGGRSVAACASTRSWA